jgi:hypothetical protein
MAKCAYIVVSDVLEIVKFSLRPKGEQENVRIQVSG